MIAHDKSTTPLRYFFETVYCRFRLIGAKPSSIGQFNFCMNAFDRFLERPATLADLSSKTLCDWMSWMVADEYSVATINGRIKLLMSLWRFAKKRKYLAADDDLSDVELLKRPRRLPTAWSIDEIERLLTACRETPGRILGIPASRYWEALVSLMFDTGLRRAAAFAIRVDEVDFNSHVLRVPAERMKNLCEQVFWLSDRTMAAILGTFPPSREILFPLACKRADTAQCRALRKIIRRAGLPAGRRDLFHKIRRSCASHLAAAGGEAVAIKQLGHSDPSCIGRYIDPRFTSNHEAAKLLPRPGWNGQKVIMEEKPASDTETAPPLIVRLSRSDWEQQGLGLLAPLCDRDGFTGRQLAAALDHLGIGCKEFAMMVKTDRRNLGAILRGNQKRIGVGLRKRIRSALGLNFVFPGLEDPPFVPVPIKEPAAGVELTADDPTIAAILDKPTWDRHDLRQLVAYAKQFSVTIIELTRRAGISYLGFHKMLGGFQNISLTTRAKLRAAFGLANDLPLFTTADVVAAYERLGMGRRRFAELLGTSAETVGNILTGRSRISPRMQRKLAAAIGAESKGGAA
jgi:integrase/transcriptional regulator with XRE-family HTH domain